MVWKTLLQCVFPSVFRYEMDINSIIYCPEQKSYHLKFESFSPEESHVKCSRPPSPKYSLHWLFSFVCVSAWKRSDVWTFLFILQVSYNLKQIISISRASLPMNTSDSRKSTWIPFGEIHAISFHNRSEKCNVLCWFGSVPQWSSVVWEAVVCNRSIPTHERHTIEYTGTALPDSCTPASGIWAV